MSKTSANILFDLEIQNTIFVSKNGDNLTGEKGNWNQPFQTIFQASNVASDGDTIYVFAGVYDEGSQDIIKSNVKYYFELGSFVTCFVQTISDFGMAKNINIDGFGVFRQTILNFNTGAISITNADTSIRFRGLQCIGVAQAISVLNCNNFDIECDLASATSQYAVQFRGNCQGRFSINKIQCTSVAPAIMFRNLGTDLVERKITGYVGEILSFATNSGAVAFLNTNNTRTELEIPDIQKVNGALSYLIEIWSGINYFKNCGGKALLGGGINTVNASSINLFENCNFVGNSGSANLQQGFNEFINCELISSGNGANPNGSINIYPAVQVELRDCLVQEKSTGIARAVINMRNALTSTFNVRLFNCKLVGDPNNNESIKNSLSGVVNTNFYVESTCATNRPIGANFTNLIAGTNIIVDSNIQRNTNTYF